MNTVINVDGGLAGNGDAMQTSKKFWDKAANRYAKSPIKDVPAYEKTMERTRHYLSEDHNVLELGCGTGSTALLLSDSVNHITASDISSAMIDIGRKKAEDQKAGNIEFVRSGLFDDALNGRTYDVVLAYNLLHLVENLPAAIRRISGLLNPNGLFISKTPCLAEKTSLLRVLVYAMRLVGQAPYVDFLKIEQMDALVADGNFEIIETGSYPAISRFIVARKM